MGSAKRLAIAMAVVAGVAVLVVVFGNPLHRSEEWIHAWILRQAPLGSTPDYVRGLVEENGWEVTADWVGQSAERTRPHYSGVEGTGILHVYLGGYQGLPWRVDVDCFFGFTATNRLVDLRVRKMYDSL